MIRYGASGATADGMTPCWLQLQRTRGNPPTGLRTGYRAVDAIAGSGTMEG
jgi:hypothetical protein